MNADIKTNIYRVAFHYDVGVNEKNAISSAASVLSQSVVSNFPLFFCTLAAWLPFKLELESGTKCLGEYLYDSCGTYHI